MTYPSLRRKLFSGCSDPGAIGVPGNSAVMLKLIADVPEGIAVGKPVAITVSIPRATLSYTLE